MGVAFREDLTSPPPSIREFCDVNVPILMFDKNANFVVKTVQEVPPPPPSPPSSHPSVFLEPLSFSIGAQRDAASPAILRPRGVGPPAWCLSVDSNKPLAAGS